MKLRTLLIRADADDRLGIGHVMRMLAVADEWLADGGRVALLGTLPPALERIVQARGVERVREARFSRESDGEQVARVAREVDAVAVIADGYGFSTEFQRSLHQTRLVVVDDNAENAPYECHGILNVNMHATERLYARRSGREVLLLGAQYTLLRREVLLSPRRQQPTLSLQRVLISYGGADPVDATGRTLTALSPASNLQIRVIVGAANSRRGALEQQASKLGAEVVAHVDNMAAQFAWADVCLCSPSTTYWEAAYLGTATITMSLADNQLAIGESLSRLGLSQYLGDVRVHSNATLARDLLRALHAPTVVETCRLNALQVCDGRGSARVVDALRGGRR